MNELNMPNMHDFDVHVCLVSGQPTPNLMPILAYKPKEVVLVVTPQAKENTQNLKSQIEKYHPDCKIHDIFIDKEYEMEKVSEQLNTISQQNPSYRIICNFTGGSKLMTYAALDIMAKHKIPLFYYSNKFINLIENTNDKVSEIKTPDISKFVNFKEGEYFLDSYLALHGYVILEKDADGNPYPPLKRPNQENKNWLPLAEKLALTYQSNELSQLNSILGKQEGNKDEKYLLPIAINNSFKNLATILEKHNLVTVNNNSMTFISPEARTYINGTWLEEYVFNIIQNIDGVQDCAMGVQIDFADKKGGAHNELDIAFMYNHTLHIIECKTKSKLDKLLPYKLNSLKKLGGLNTRVALISFYEVNKSIQSRLKTSKIEIIQTNQFSNLKEFLEKWVQQTLKGTSREL